MRQLRQKLKGSTLVELKNATLGLDRAKQKSVFISKDGKLSRDEKYIAIWNVDQNHLATIATTRYKIVQHKDAIGAVLDEIQRYGFTGKGVIRDYQDVVTLEFIFDNIKFSPVQNVGDIVHVGIRVTNSINKTTGLNGSIFAKRMVCLNGMMANKILKNGVLREVHIGNLNAKHAIRKFLKVAIDSTELLRKYVSEALKDSFEMELATKVLFELFKVDKYRKAITEKLQEKKDEFGNLTRW
ncbi:DUF932 domain-containing protein, partial [candidate division TA06 bacterium]|nr:DUF932 domain-containing protein [candidate division TA06 bacterium]